MPDRRLLVFEAVIWYGNGIEVFSRYFIEKAKQMDNSSYFATESTHICAKWDELKGESSKVRLVR